MDQVLLQDIIAYSNTWCMSFADSYARLITQAGGQKALYSQYDMSKREITEFEHKWQLGST
jgi:hypothetical protein